MGTIYVTHPIDPNIGDWLTKLEIEIPSGESRAPTPSEIFEALRSFSDSIIKESWQSHGSHYYSLERNAEDWTELILNDDSDSQSVELSFRHGNLDFIIEICRAMAKFCGPFVLVSDSNAPILITAI